jgi:hypothetical protein
MLPLRNSPGRPRSRRLVRSRPSRHGGAPGDASPPARERGTIGRCAIASIAVSAAALVPWTGYLWATLPPAVTARHWPLVWSGLDGGIAVGLAASAWLAWRGDRRLVQVTAATAALMAADAWFDVCTSPPGRPLAWALVDMVIEATVAATCLMLPRLTRRPASPVSAGPGAPVTGDPVRLAEPGPGRLVQASSGRPVLSAARCRSAGS